MTNEQVAYNLAMHIYKNQNSDGYCSKNVCNLCFNKIYNRLLPSVEKKQKIEFIMPAFPFKSPSEDKCLSNIIIDKAEEVSISFLSKFFAKSNKIYSHGVKLNIFSDGLIFSPIKEISDDIAIQYSNLMRKIIKTKNATNYINIISLDILYNNIEQGRELIFKKFGNKLDTIKKNVKENKLLNNTFNSVHKFYYEEIKGQFKDASNCQNSKKAKERAYRTIQAADALSKFIDAKYPNMIRLSCHSQPCDSNKIGFHLVNPIDYTNITPWHSVGIKIDKSFKLVKNDDAKKYAQLKKDTLGLYYYDSISHVHVKNIKYSAKELPPSLR